MYRYMDTFMFMYLKRTMADHWRDMRVSRDQPCAKHSEAVTIYKNIKHKGPMFGALSNLSQAWAARCTTDPGPVVLVYWVSHCVVMAGWGQYQLPLPGSSPASRWWCSSVLAKRHGKEPFWVSLVSQEIQGLASWSIARLRKKTTISTGWNWSSEATTKIIFDLWRAHTKGGPGRPPAFVSSDRNLEPNFGNLPYPEKVPVFARSDLGKIDKIMMVLRFCEIVHRNQNLEPLPKMVLGEPNLTTFSQFFTRKVPVKLAE